MDTQAPRQLNPISFLQAFIVHGIRAVEQRCADGDRECHDHVVQVGLATSGCLEEVARRHLGLNGRLDPEQYANVVIEIKNRIGGRFEHAPGEAGSIRVINHRCPFGDLVKDAPELCRMTSSVFGAIAARSFGYAKVELHKRIATHDGLCDVRIHTDPDGSADRPGDEYRCEGDTVTALSASAAVTRRLEERLCDAWSPPPASAQRHRLRRRIVAESPAMRTALQTVEVVAPTQASVLVTGETGVGKEVIARAVHALSDRAERIFLAVNCGAIPENLMESALFGHERGAFTDAYETREGFFERADGGTLFLDEIDSLPLPAQPRLLRVLQDGEYERVGGRHTRHTDVRIVTASSRPLERLVTEGRFRRDLYYRLNVVPIEIPPLRERPDDIVALVSQFLERLAERYGGRRKVLGERAWATAINYAWPGNLRELENVLERAYLFARGTVIDSIPVGSETDGSTPVSLREAKKHAAMAVEARVIIDAMAHSRGNVSAVARRMGITPRAVHMKLRTHGIDPAAYRERRAGTPGGRSMNERSGGGT